MEKLELKHIVGYLPYGLKMIDTSCNNIWKLIIYDFSSIGFFDKPILRPLSDITSDTYDFIYNKECDYPSIEDWINLDTESRMSCKFSYEFWQLLYEHHFDIHGLIEKGLAIDLNTLNNGIQ